MNKRKDYYAFKVIRWLVKIFYKKFEIANSENIPKKPSIIVANHTQMNGPIACEIYLDNNFYTWCVGQMMIFKDVPSYAYKDFWSQKPKYSRPFYKILSYLIAPLAVCIFNNARTIAVFHDNRTLSTFKNTIKMLSKGKNIVIFPEHDKKYNNIIYDFQDKFIDIAKLYYKKTGEELDFVPMYIAPSLNKMYFGKPIHFDSSVPIEIERQKICNYLMKEITDMAVSLPLHKVTPYRNIPKKYYPYNKPEVYENEKTDC